MIKAGDTVKFLTRHGHENEGVAVDDQSYRMVGGRSATKHSVVDTSVWGQGVRVRAPIIDKDGNTYMARGQVAPGIHIVKVGTPNVTAPIDY